MRFMKDNAEIAFQKPYPRTACPALVRHLKAKPFQHYLQFLKSKIFGIPFQSFDQLFPFTHILAPRLSTIIIAKPSVFATKV